MPAEKPPAPAASTASPPRSARPEAAPPLNFDNNVYFDLGKANISDRGYQTLASHAERLKADRKIVVTLVGHTDGVGSRAFNLALGDARVEAVAKYLRSQGVANSQIRRLSLGGETRSDCRSEECRRSLRKVELTYPPPP